MNKTASGKPGAVHPVSKYAGSRVPPDVLAQCLRHRRTIVRMPRVRIRLEWLPGWPRNALLVA